MKIEGFVICHSSTSEKGKWYPREHTFAKTPLESWISFLNIPYGGEQWDRQLQRWMNAGYCPKKATLEIDV